MKTLLEKNKEKIKFLYFEEELSLKSIAKEIGVCPATIRNKMIYWGMSRRETRKRNLTRPTKKELEELYISKQLPIDKVSYKLSVAPSTIFRWMNAYEICTRKLKYKKYNFSGDPKEKAYILGLVAGDLHVHRHCKQIMVELTTTHPAMIDVFYNVFQKYGTPKKYLKYNKITGRYEWNVYILLDNSFNFMLTDDLNIDNEYFYDFLAGFFDSEGCLHLYNNHGYIGLTTLIYNSNKKLLDIINERLEKDGFHHKFSKFFNKGEKTTNNYYRKNDLWAIRLHIGKEVLSLMKLIPIRHREKLDKLKLAVSRDNKKWNDISNEVDNLKMRIKKEIQVCLNPIKESAE